MRVGNIFVVTVYFLAFVRFIFGFSFFSNTNKKKFAFVSFSDVRDAEDAKNEMNHKNLGGR